MTTRKSVAVVGCGVGRSHIRDGYAPFPDRWRLAALCDLDAARLDATADEFGFESRTQSFDDLLARSDIDVIDLATPPATHFDLARRALEAGKHVACEKPLVGSLADADRLLEIQRASGRYLLPIFQYRYGDGVQKAKRIIDAGLAGRPYVASLETHWKRDADYYAVPWRGRWQTELGGVLVTHAIHLHDMLGWLMGPITRVFARASTRVNAIEVEDCVAASLEMASGALVTTSCTLGSQREVSRIRLCFENVTFEHDGPNPYRPGEEPWSILPANAEVAAAIDRLLADYQPVPAGYGGLMCAFHDAINGLAEVPVTTADGRRSLELATAFYQSAESGQDVALPIAPDHLKYQRWWPDIKSG